MPQREVITRETAEPLTEAHMALARSIASWTEKASRLETEIPGLSLARYEQQTEPTSYMHEPSICMVAQGANGLSSAKRSLSTMTTIFSLPR